MFYPVLSRPVSFPFSAILVSTLALFLSWPAFAQSEVAPPKSVSALVYSSSAIELFWEPTNGLVQISRNGQFLGEFDSRSRFEPNLEQSKTYHYELKTINSSGQVSSPVFLSVSTSNFTLPIKRVWPIGQTQTISPPPPEPINTMQASVDDGAGESAAAIDWNSSGSSDSSTDSAATTYVAQTSDNCIARDVNSLLSCVRNVNAYRRIDINQDIRCDNNCCPNGSALIRLSHVNNLEINGHGHKITRTQNQRQCELLDIDDASNIKIQALQLDDDKNASGCQVGDNCPSMVHIKRSNNIEFFDTHISHGKGYAFYVQGTNGFKFERSSLHNSGVLGMYIGHGNDASSNVRISNSTFSDNQTNGLALLGVKGQSIDSNVVADNLFVRNHRKGQWAVEPQYGTGLTGGGQLYLAEASNVTVRNNVIRDGYCDNCFIQNKYRSGISGIELGIPNQNSLSNIEIANNRIVNQDGFGIWQNINSSLAMNVSVRANTLLNNSDGERLQGAKKSNNWVSNTQHFISFENANDLSTQFSTDLSCSIGGSVARRCNGEAQFGQCVVQLELGKADCGDARAYLQGPKKAIKPGQVVILSGWVKSPMGRWCAEFQDASGHKLSEQCKQMTDAGWSDVQSFVGMPTIEAYAPERSATVHMYVEHRQAWGSMQLDDLILSVGNAR